MPDPAEPDRLDLAIAEAQSSLDRLREVLDDIDHEIGGHRPRQVRVDFTALNDDGLPLQHQVVMLTEGAAGQDVRMAFYCRTEAPGAGVEFRDATVRVTAR